MTPSSDFASGAVGTADKIQLIDSDVHNYPDGLEELFPYLSERWVAYARQGGLKLPGASHYPKVYQHAARRDAYPPGGGVPGSDPEFAREQLLDAWQIHRAILNPLVGVSSVHNIDLANALMRATNEWTADRWLAADPRWRGAIVVNVRDPQASAAEIRRAAADPRFVQVLLLVRSHAPYGRREFLPISIMLKSMGSKVS